MSRVWGRMGNDSCENERQGENDERLGGCGWRWKTCQLSYSSPEFFVVQSARTKKEILFCLSPVGFLFFTPRRHSRRHCSRLPFLHPPLALSFPFSLIESSNFRLHSPSACLLCTDRWEFKRTLCRNLGTRTRWRVAQDGGVKGNQTGKERKRRKTEKNKEARWNVESSYSYSRREKSSPRKDERLALLCAARGRNLVGRDLSLWKMAPSPCTVAEIFLLIQSSQVVASTKWRAPLSLFISLFISIKLICLNKFS